MQSVGRITSEMPSFSRSQQDRGSNFSHGGTPPRTGLKYRVAPNTCISEQFVEEGIAAVLKATGIRLTREQCIGLVINSRMAEQLAIVAVIDIQTTATLLDTLCEMLLRKFWPHARDEALVSELRDKALSLGYYVEA